MVGSIIWLMEQSTLFKKLLLFIRRQSAYRVRPRAGVAGSFCITLVSWPSDEATNMAHSCMKLQGRGGGGGGGGGSSFIPQIV